MVARMERCSLFVQGGGAIKVPDFCHPVTDVCGVVVKSMAPIT